MAGRVRHSICRRNQHNQPGNNSKLAIVREDCLANAQDLVEPITDLDASAVIETEQRHPADGTKQNQYNGFQEKSPIHKTKHRETLKTGHLRIARQGTVYMEPWDASRSNHSTPLCVAEKPAKGNKPPPLKFQFPDVSIDSHGSSIRDNSLPFTASSGSNSDHASLLNSYGCSSIESDPSVRPLPVSPAQYMNASSAGPGGQVAMDTYPIQTGPDDLNNNSVFNYTANNSVSICRICHEDASEEGLVSPCHCAGTMGMLHVTCLEKWLGTSETTKCEICSFQFTVQKKPCSVTWYLNEPSLQTDRQKLLQILIAVCLLGLMAVVLTTLCLIYSQRLRNAGEPSIAVFIVILPILIFAAYTGWLFIAVRRIQHFLLVWKMRYHMINISPKLAAVDRKVKKTIYRSFTVTRKDRVSATCQNTPRRNMAGFPSLDYSLESYTEAMYNPVTPPYIPLLQDQDNGHLDQGGDPVAPVISHENHGYQQDINNISHKNHGYQQDINNNDNNVKFLNKDSPSVLGGDTNTKNRCGHPNGNDGVKHVVTERRPSGAGQSASSENCISSKIYNESYNSKIYNESYTKSLDWNSPSVLGIDDRNSQSAKGVTYRNSPSVLGIDDRNSQSGKGVTYRNSPSVEGVTQVERNSPCVIGVTQVERDSPSIIGADRDSPSVIGVDEPANESCSFYCPPECGVSTLLLYKTGDFVRETGV